MLEYISEPVQNIYQPKHEHNDSTPINPKTRHLFICPLCVGTEQRKMTVIQLVTNPKTSQVHCCIPALNLLVLSLNPHLYRNHTLHPWHKYRLQLVEHFIVFQFANIYSLYATLFQYLDSQDWSKFTQYYFACTTCSCPFSQTFHV